MTCARCGCGVLNAEDQIIMNKVWHKCCFRCSRCNKVLDKSTAKLFQGEIYCECCHAIVLEDFETLLKPCRVVSSPSCVCIKGDNQYISKNRLYDHNHNKKYDKRFSTELGSNLNRNIQSCSCIPDVKNKTYCFAFPMPREVANYYNRSRMRKKNRCDSQKRQIQEETPQPRLRNHTPPRKRGSPGRGRRTESPRRGPPECCCPKYKCTSSCKKCECFCPPCQRPPCESSSPCCLCRKCRECQWRTCDGKVKNQPIPKRNQDRAIRPMDKLLLTLRFLATGDFYISIGDFGGVHKSTASRIIKQGINAICNMFPQFIHFPNTEREKQEAKRDFHNISRFPRVIGAIDCTHVKIMSPGGENAEVFRNRKGYFSLNCQVVGSANLKIIDLVCRWPGSAHDSHIFDNSAVKMKFLNNEMGNGVLIGDQGYRLQQYLLTAIENPHNEAERLYNESLIRIRNSIERLFGVWKRRFPILSNGIRCDINMAQMIVVACAVLHNIAVDQNECDFEENQFILEDPEALHIMEDRDENARTPFIDYFQGLLNQRN